MKTDHCLISSFDKCVKSNTSLACAGTISWQSVVERGVPHSALVELARVVLLLYGSPQVKGWAMDSTLAVLEELIGTFVRPSHVSWHRGAAGTSTSKSDDITKAHGWWHHKGFAEREFINADPVVFFHLKCWLLFDSGWDTMFSALLKLVRGDKRGKRQKKEDKDLKRQAKDLKAQLQTKEAQVRTHAQMVTELTRQLESEVNENKALWLQVEFLTNEVHRDSWDPHSDKTMSTANRPTRRLSPRSISSSLSRSQWFWSRDTESWAGLLSWVTEPPTENCQESCQESLSLREQDHLVFKASLTL